LSRSSRAGRSKNSAQKTAEPELSYIHAILKFSSSSQNPVLRKTKAAISGGPPF
jgi:hypothetical protein